MVVVAFQITFRAEMYQNDIFFKKNLFLRVARQNDPKQTKKLIFFGNAVCTAFPNGNM